MKWNTENRGSHFLYPLAISTVRDGAEPERSGKGSAEPYLVV
jgi:hypothetical protein